MEIKKITCRVDFIHRIGKLGNSHVFTVRAKQISWSLSARFLLYTNLIMWCVGKRTLRGGVYTHKGAMGNVGCVSQRTIKLYMQR